MEPTKNNESWVEDLVSDLKHTPGPWETGNGNCHTVYGPKTHGHRITIASCPTQDRDKDYSSRNAFANAKLIAAAPDLLEALNAYVQAQQFVGEDFYTALNNARIKALIALAKAEGRE